MEKPEGTTGAKACKCEVSWCVCCRGTDKLFGIREAQLEGMVVEAEPRGAVARQPVCLRGDSISLILPNFRGPVSLFSR